MYIRCSDRKYDKEEVMMTKKLILLLFVFCGCLLSSTPMYAQVDQLSTPPSYQFQSTSTYSSVVGESSFSSTPVYSPGASEPINRSPRRDSWNPWGEEGGGDPSDEGIGQVNTPVGSPLCLIGIALIYGLCLLLRRRRIFPSRLT